MVSIETIGIIAVVAALWAANRYGRRINAGEARFDSETGKLLPPYRGRK